MFWKYAANPQENIHAEVQFQQSNFIEVTLWHECSPVNLLHIFRTIFLKNTFGRLFPMLHIWWNIHQFIFCNLVKTKTSKKPLPRDPEYHPSKKTEICLCTITLIYTLIRRMNGTTLESQVFLSFIRKPPRNFNSDSVKMTNQSTLLIWCWHKHFHGAIYRRVLIQILYMFQVGKFENVVFDK